ncbi:PEP-CTERM sorting domain-containing protein [Thalassomonas viridans]|uniref:PEP-CTERM sorting domain-containing protein n=1 Tax=Thalassomonas viridans TaxID=137584 RepID=A0AAE9Z8Z0_9GAMM|nr:PEP-CTERM sorting domain-containing protein [Thalassomonas viridans]WDE07493.1 PEP-CTERM sorting domain-containing protein [Thalassomonas viridans]
MYKNKMQKTHVNNLFSLVVLTLLVMLLSLRPVKASTIILDFTSNPSTNIFGVSTNAFDSSPFGFTGLSHNQVIESIFDTVVEDFFGYVYPSLPPGKELDLDFEIGTIGSGPQNGDSDYSYFKIGEDYQNQTGSLGHACLSCALPDYFTYSPGAVVGSIFTDNLLNLAQLALTDDDRINLIAGTTSHEIGHALSLPHPSGAEANPGESSFGLMGTGASPANMPNGERILDRAFSYSNFDRLISAIGLRDISVEVPEPGTVMLMLLSLGLMVSRRKLIK